MIIHSLEGRHRQRVVEFFEAGGVDGKRIEFFRRLSPEKYFEVYQRVDLGLDPFPYPGHTTLLDGLWMGVPSVVTTGSTAVSRGAASILSTLGLADWVARDRDEYIAKAVAAAGDLQRLARLRATLREKLAGSELMDGAGFASRLEQRFRGLWKNWCNFSGKGASKRAST